MKQVILMRTDLGMTIGKMCAQSAHVACEGYRRAREDTRCQPWFEEGLPVVVLGVPNEEHLVYLLKKAQDANLFTSCVQDAGRNEVPRGTLTCGAIGPWEDAVINRITRHLQAL